MVLSELAKNGVELTQDDVSTIIDDLNIKSSTFGKEYYHSLKNELSSLVGRKVTHIETTHFLKVGNFNSLSFDALEGRDKINRIANTLQYWKNNPPRWVKLSFEKSLFHKENIEL